VSKKNGKAVPVAEAKKPKKDEVPKDPLSEPIVIPENIRELALGTGLPIDQVVDRANLIQSRILGIETAIMTIAQGLDERDKTLMPLVNLAKQIEAQQKAMPQTPVVPQQSQGLGQLAQLLPLLSGSSEPDPMTKAFMQAVFNAGIENMFMGSALVKTIVTKVAPEMYAEAIKKAGETIKTGTGTS